MRQVVFFRTRTALLRLVAAAALVASAMLTADHLHPERSFCPLEAACHAAASSALGSVLGVPTSVLGLAAFGLLFTLTLLPVEWSRPWLRPAGFVASVSGLGFLAFQAAVLGTFCPLCLVADAAAIAAGVITLTWPTPPIRLSGRRLEGESLFRRATWTALGIGAVALPLVWPRSAEPSWVEIEPPAAALFEAAGPIADGSAVAEEEAPEPIPEPDLFYAEAPAPPAPRRHAVAPAASRVAPAVRAPAIPPADGDPGLAPSPDPSAAPRPDPTPRPAGTAAPPRIPAVAGGRAPTSTVPASVAAPRPARTTPTAEPPPAASDPPVLIVVYLNAYCPHCRATHERLKHLLAERAGTYRVRRVYAWGGSTYPTWVRACAVARTRGLEQRLFEELLKSRDDSVRELYAAATRAGLDAQALQQALRQSTVPEWLVRDTKIMRSAGLRGLPTIDVGHRRLVGEQSERELEAALDAAL